MASKEDADVNVRILGNATIEITDNGEGISFDFVAQSSIKPQRFLEQLITTPCIAQDPERTTHPPEVFVEGEGFRFDLSLASAAFASANMHASSMIVRTVRNRMRCTVTCRKGNITNTEINQAVTGESSGTRMLIEFDRQRFSDPVLVPLQVATLLRGVRFARPELSVRLFDTSDKLILNVPRID